MPLATPVSPETLSEPLLEGDCLTSSEFIRRWEDMPDLKRAELIDGFVNMPSPVSVRHEDTESRVSFWLSSYELATPGCRSGLEATWVMGERNVPQPDITLTILPEYGGQSRIEGQYHSGAPELVVEVAVSSYSRDFGAKKRLYEQMGVREYGIVLPGEEKLFWFGRSAAGFQPLEPGADGILRSACFPGLWLNVAALWKLDLRGIHEVLQQGLATPEHAEFATGLIGPKS